MCTDLAAPGILGYFMTMLYNPNNVALEASPFTTVAELKAGQQLCKMFGYNTIKTQAPLSWGHITADGTIANLESIWVGMLFCHSSVAISNLRLFSTKSQVLPTCVVYGY